MGSCGKLLLLVILTLLLGPIGLVIAVILIVVDRPQERQNRANRDTSWSSIGLALVLLAGLLGYAYLRQHGYPSALDALRGAIAPAGSDTAAVATGAR